MNHLHSLIRNPATQSDRTTPELHRSFHSRTHGNGPHKKLILALAIAAVAGGAQAAPLGGDVVSGGATITVSGTTTAIDQTTDAVTINWQGFDIDADETVNFYQPDANSLALNRVLSGNGTEIQGQLNANGRVFILDANGVLFGETAQVNVGSLVASTLDMTAADFENNHFEFSGSGNPAAVTNLGRITVADSGAVALLGGQVTNNGIIRARMGNVALAAGNQITLDFAGDGLLNVKIDEGTAQALAKNGGLIQADGGSVLMTAHASDALLQTVVNNTGVIEARTLQEQDGKIMLLGGFNGGTVNVNGTLDVSAPEGGDGGFVETSGAVVKVRGDAQIKLASASGEAGSWLIDPTDMEISYDSTGANDEVSHVHTQALQNSLAGGDVILTTADAGGEAGNITILNPIVWASGNRLTLNADNDIIFNDYLHAPNGGLTLNAANSITTGAEGHINVDSFVLTNGSFTQIAATLPTFIARDFTLNGGTFTRATGGNGTDSPLQITDIYGLQGLDTTLDLDAALVNDIDASGTPGWNGGEGFDPIGDATNSYTGAFDGQDHVIDGLTINRPTAAFVGLFGFNSSTATVTAVGLERGAITGNVAVGGLVGVNEGSISHSYFAGAVEGSGYAGGLVGRNEGSIQASYATGAVLGNSYAGGLVGFNDGGIQTSYATGAVLGNSYAGGLVGFNEGGIQTSYATGTVSNAIWIGGFAGFDDGDIQTSYWDSFTTGRITAVGNVPGHVGVSEVNGDWAGAADAYNQATYADLDFGTVWFIAEGSSRPMLRAFLSGDGSISNLYQLQGMAADLSGTYTLTQDIDASATASTDNADIWGGRGFAPVGNSFGEFTGSLDGQGFVINGLTINRPDQNNVGLFGRASNTATLTGIGLEGGAISGNNLVGTLVGWNGGDVTNSYATGAVNGNGIQIGGLVGFNQGDITTSYATGAVDATGYVGGLVGWNNNIITSSYATGMVAGTDHVGGFAGYNNGTITTNYATGAVQGIDRVGGLVGFNNGITNSSYATGAVDGTTNVGGLVGINMNAFNTSYWDGHSTGMGATGAGSDPFGEFSGTQVNGNWATLVPGNSAYSAANYGGLDFGADWFIAEGSSRPMLRAFLSGGGEIHNLYDLQGMAAYLGDAYTLMADIDASATAASVASGNFADVWGGRGFAPVGVNGNGFTGSLNGAGFVIDGLTINRPDQDDVGLIGFGSAGANLTRVLLENVDITGDSGVGALLGRGTATISQSYATGAVTGGDVVGGLVGSSLAGSISESYAAVITDGDDQVGGLVGVNSFGSSVANSYSIGSVTSLGNGGGLIGFNAAGGTITQSYSLGSVNAAADAGGLVAVNDGAIVDSFWSTDVELAGVGSGDATGATGLTNAEFTQLTSFASWGADIDDAGGTGAVWRIYEGRSAPLLRNFLPEIDVIAYDDTLVYDGDPYQGLHQINGTSGNGVRYGTNYAQFLEVFGEDGTPYGVMDDVGSSDLEYIGDSQGAVDAGEYDLTLSELWSHQLGYDIVLNHGTLTITPAGVSITVTVDDASKVYGNADPAFSWAVTAGDLADGDTLTGTLTRQPGENVGNYTIFGNVNGDLASGNYTVTMNNGVFTITPRPITISVADASKIYGEADPDFSWALTSGNLVFGHTLTGDLVRAPGENVGDYAIGANLTGPVGSGNYAVTLNEGTLTITPRDIVIDIANLDKIYGESDPEFTWAVTSGGLVEGDELSGTLTRAPGENVGGYTISGMVDGDLANGNYSYTLNNGMLTISPRPLVLTADNLMKIYGEEDPELTWSITNGSLVGDDTLMVSVSREDGSNVGTYAIMLDAGGDATNSNYDLSLVDGQLQITPADLTVTADDVTGYWDLLPAFTASIDGLVNGDTEASVFGDSLNVISNLVIPVPGNYVLTPVASMIGENYQVSFVDGLLTLLSSNPGGNYIEALTSTQLPAREALGRERRSNIYEGRSLLDGSEDDIVLHVLDGGVRLDPETLAAFGIVFPDAVNFPVNSAVVDERYFAKLREFVQQLKQFPDVHVLVEGHTSSTGSLALNQRLSERRAEAVAKVLEEMGLATDRMRTEHFNYQRPVATNDTPEGRYLNQRTEMVEDEQKR